MKDWECGMFLEWALLSQTQTCQNHDILENMRKENIVPRFNTQICNTINTLDSRFNTQICNTINTLDSRFNTQICNTINTLDSRNWCNFSSANAASHVFIHEVPEFQKEVKEKESVFEKIRKALYTLVDELNGVIESLIEL